MISVRILHTRTYDSFHFRYTHFFGVIQIIFRAIKNRRLMFENVPDETQKQILKNRENLIEKLKK